MGSSSTLTVSRELRAWEEGARNAGFGLWPLYPEHAQEQWSIEVVITATV